MIRAVILDLDNTLLDFVKLKEFAIEGGVESMIEAGLEVHKGNAKNRLMQIYEEKGWEYQMVFDDFIKETLGYLDYKILAAGIVGYRKAKEAALSPYPNVDRTLKELAKLGLKLAVVSDAPSREAWLRLSYLNLQNLFDVVVAYEDTGKRKPDAAPFLVVLDRLSVDSEQTLMVGDRPERDMVGASRLGMKTVFARYGDTFDTVDSGADYEIDDFLELVDIVKKENNRS